MRRHRPPFVAGFVIRVNPGTGRWVVYVLTGYRLGPARPVYAIAGVADTAARAIEGIYV